MSQLQAFIDAGIKLEQIIREEINSAGTIDEDALILRVQHRIALDRGLAETLARRHLYRECVRAFNAREQV